MQLGCYYYRNVLLRRSTLQKINVTAFSVEKPKLCTNGKSGIDPKVIP
jgi:hypothetical protein